MSRIHVVAAVIYSPDRQRILISRRPDHVHQGGLWEFPGGKVQFGETPAEALIRELKEELAICIERASPLMKISHDYPDKKVLLDFWQVDAFNGTECGIEGQEMAWVSVADLSEFDFPAANQTVVKRLVSKMSIVVGL